MRHIQKFNELKSSTYYSAADKLGKLKHVKRSSDIRSWGSSVEDKEREEEIEKSRLKWSSSGVYDVKLYTSKWLASSGGKPGGFSYSDIIQGKFHVNFEYERDMFSDQYWDWSESDYDSDLFMSFSMGILPADKETSLEFNEIPNINDDFDLYNGALWTQWLMIKIAKAGDVNLNPINHFSIDQIDSYRFSFTSRSEALKFKKFFVSELSGKSNFTGVKDRIEKHIALIKTDTTNYKGNIPDNFMDKLVDSASKMSLNILYKE